MLLTDYNINKRTETKSLIGFHHKEEDLRCYVLSKADFKQAMQKLERWQMYGGDCFSSMLFTMIAKADGDNLSKFFNGFPAETLAYLVWMESGNEAIKNYTSEEFYAGKDC